MKYALATANPGKIKEIREILSNLGIDFVTREDLGIDFDIEETGDTFFENAKLKAEAICKASNMPAIADDSGLVVDALDGAPGVYTSSYGGEELSNDERYMYMLDKMKNIDNMEQRTAKFVSTIVCAYPDGKILTASGECEGHIAKSPRGTGGFGYDPVFVPAGEERTLAEMSLVEKNAISHRGKALRKFAEVLKE